jgi:hypothetical protein
MKICTILSVVFLAALTDGADRSKLDFSFGFDTIVKPEYLTNFKKFLWPKGMIPYQIAKNTFGLYSRKFR